MTCNLFDFLFKKKEIEETKPEKILNVKELVYSNLLRYNNAEPLKDLNEFLKKMRDKGRFCDTFSSSVLFFHLPNADLIVRYLELEGYYVLEKNFNKEKEQLELTISIVNSRTLGSCYLKKEN